MDNILETAWEVTERFRAGGARGCAVERVALSDVDLGAPVLDQVRLGQCTLQGVGLSEARGRSPCRT